MRKSKLKQVKRNKQASERIIKLPNMFVFREDTLQVTDGMVDFLIANMFLTTRNISEQETGRLSIFHFVLDRASIEEKFDGVIDDGTLEYLIDSFDEDFKVDAKEYLEGVYEHLQLKNIIFKYADGVIHSYALFSQKD